MFFFFVTTTQTEYIYSFVSNVRVVLVKLTIMSDDYCLFFQNLAFRLVTVTPKIVCCQSLDRDLDLDPELDSIELLELFDLLLYCGSRS